MSKEITLSSGALLKVSAASFAESKALYQAVLKELKDVSILNETEVINLYKELFCVGFSSLEIERCLWKCMERCTYNSAGHNLKIVPDIFEPEEARQDFVQICIEVAKENIEPFMSALFLQYKNLSKMGGKNQKSK